MATHECTKCIEQTKKIIAQKDLDAGLVYPTSKCESSADGSHNWYLIVNLESKILGILIHYLS